MTASNVRVWTRLRLTSYGTTVTSSGLRTESALGTHLPCPLGLRAFPEGTLGNYRGSDGHGDIHLAKRKNGCQAFPYPLVMLWKPCLLQT